MLVPLTSRGSGHLVFSAYRAIIKPMEKPNFTHKRLILILFIGFLAIIGIATGIVLLERRANAPKAAPVIAKAVTSAVTSPPPAAQPFDKLRYSTSDPSSLWVIVNKQHPLKPIDYTPSDLVTMYGKLVRRGMGADLTAMVTDAAKAGANLTLASSYRSYQYQVGLYNSYVAGDSQANADTYSARPGYSEHQTGLAIDFSDKAGKCIVADCYGTTPEGQWLAVNAYKYGFLLRYTAPTQTITGYESEPWHYRYVGRYLTLEMHKQNIPTLEQFFNVTGGENY
jgi:D-alanyl-D-alanine carboxypeptidase